MKYPATTNKSRPPTIRKSQESPPTVVVDPGHGREAPWAMYGADMGAPSASPLPSGAFAPGTVFEADVALALAGEVSNALQGRGLASVQTRTGVKPLSHAQPRLGWRVTFANADSAEPEAFVSIHFNSPSTTASGMSVHWRYTGEQLALAESIRDHQTTMNINNAYSTPTAGLSQNAYLVLGGLDMPGVLIEIAFITNLADLAFVQANIADIAEDIAAGIEAYIEEVERERRESQRGQWLDPG